MPLSPTQTKLRTAATVLLSAAAALLLAAPATALSLGINAASHPPKTPKNVACDPQSDGVHVTWDAVADATSYNVWRKVGNNGAWMVIGSAPTNSYVDHTAASGQLYHYAVSALNADGESNMSGTCNVVSIPVFPTPVALSIGVVGALGATGLMFRRRRA
ncbi:MAG TPA: hypothetical protein VM241_00995 [Candidatus Thermoplasmatota archaeon]|nr:hypothetical protein [Candidatus Thermoplasmatota archaeon]